MYEYIRTSLCYFTPVEYCTTYPLYRTQNFIESKAAATAKCNKNLLGNSRMKAQYFGKRLCGRCRGYGVICFYIGGRGSPRGAGNLWYSEQYPRVISKLVYTLAT